MGVPFTGLIFGQTARVVVKKYTIGELTAENTKPHLSMPMLTCLKLSRTVTYRFLGNSNSSLIRTKSGSLGFTSYIYCKFNLENPNP